MTSSSTVNSPLPATLSHCRASSHIFGPHRVAACDLVLEYTLSAAAVAKGFTAYFASLIGVDLKHLRLQVGGVAST